MVKQVTIEFPESVEHAIASAVAKYPNDIDKARKHAEAAIRKLPEFKSLVDQFISKAIQEMVYDCRHTENVRTKRQAGYYGQRAKLKVGESVRRAYQSTYDYYIAGRTLGEIKGAELADIASSESEKANGHRFNSMLCTTLKSMVPADKRVKDVMPEKKLRTIFQRVLKQAGQAA